MAGRDPWSGASRSYVRLPQVCKSLDKIELVIPVRKYSLIFLSDPISMRLSCLYAIFMEYIKITSPMDSYHSTFAYRNMVLDFKVSSLMEIYDILFWRWASTPQHVSVCDLSPTDCLNGAYKNMQFYNIFPITLTPTNYENLSYYSFY